jgi:hypothetical protein
MTPALQLSFPDAEVGRIAAMTDPAARNRLITEAYSRLSVEVARRVEGHANWCTYATWASRQAGVTIRHEDLVDVLRERMRGVLHLRGLPKHCWNGRRKARWIYCRLWWIRWMNLAR